MLGLCFDSLRAIWVLLLAGVPLAEACTDDVDTPRSLPVVVGDFSVVASAGPEP